MTIEPPPCLRISGRQCLTERNTPSRLIAVLLAPVGERHVDDRWHGDADAGIGDENIEPAVELGDFGDDIDPALLAGDVLLQEYRLAAGFRHALGELGPAQLIDVGDDNGRALAREQLDDRLADTRGAAGHQRDLALNLPCHVHSLFCCLRPLSFTHDLCANAFRVCRIRSCVI
ncbi:hypothetical protein ABH988_004766 [Bradyrhizobium ottawaense]